MKPRFVITMVLRTGEEADSIELHKKALEKAIRDSLAVYDFEIQNIIISHVSEDGVVS